MGEVEGLTLSCGWGNGAETLRFDSWGRGISKITEACAAAKLPKPLIEETQGGIRVTLFVEHSDLDLTRLGPSWDQVGTKLGLSSDQVSEVSCSEGETRRGYGWTSMQDMIEFSVESFKTMQGYSNPKNGPKWEGHPQIHGTSWVDRKAAFRKK
jgi:hypothetical protein